MVDPHRFLLFFVQPFPKTKLSPQDVDGLCTTNEGRVATGECLHLVPRDNSREPKMDNHYYYSIYAGVFAGVFSGDFQEYLQEYVKDYLEEFFQEYL